MPLTANRRFFWYKPKKDRFKWQRYKMSGGQVFQMMRFGVFGVNYYGR